MNKRLLLLVVLTFFIPTISRGTIQNDVIEQVEQQNEVRQSVREKKGSWVPVPIPISNPTIGSGLQAALLYLHPKDSDDPKTPGATSGVVGMYTDSNSWLVGGFHDGNYKNDLYRYRIIAGTGEFNLDYYGIGEGSNLRSEPTPYTLESDIAIAQLLRQIPGTEDWYFGFRYMYLNSNVTFDFSNTVPGLPPISDNMTNSGLGLMFNYDTRDNNYYPTSGSLAEIVWMRDREEIGSDFNFDKLTSFYNHYLPFTQKDTLAMRVTLANADGDVPFYLLPSLRLRGFAAGKYKDNASFSGHLEWRQKFHPRWGFIAFYEAGSVARTVNTLLQSEIITSVGGGLRWQVTEDKKLNLGIDVGYSDGDNAIYVQVGEKF